MKGSKEADIQRKIEKVKIKYVKYIETDSGKFKSKYCDTVSSKKIMHSPDSHVLYINSF